VIFEKNIYEYFLVVNENIPDGRPYPCSEWTGCI
jgi:hypothetical protein